MSKGEFPKISIVTAVFNNAAYIEDCLLSVLTQDYPNLEYIVIDGGSTDGTAGIIEKYRDRLAYAVSEPDRGQTHALNKGFSRATGDVLGWLNADEEYLPGTLAEVGRAFSENPELDFYYGQRIVVDSSKQEIGRREWVSMPPKWHLLYRMYVLPTDASFWSRRAHELTGELDEERFPRLSMDYDWLLRLSFNIRRWKSTASYLSKYTERPDRVTMLGAAADSAATLKNNYLARSMVIERHRLSRAGLAAGWLIAGIYSRIREGRWSRPHLGVSLKRLFLIADKQ